MRSLGLEICSQRSIIVKIVLRNFKPLKYSARVLSTPSVHCYFSVHFETQF